mmetsp:Transcript_1802/g.1923  ORF Transcript_1802/g.1923 Transcript_1802/m.1923 type:complete len:266 (-) Transcript_1802:4075-4872(-)
MAQLLVLPGVIGSVFWTQPHLLQPVVHVERHVNNNGGGIGVVDTVKHFGFFGFGSRRFFVVLEKISHSLQVVGDLHVRKTFPQAFSHPCRSGMALSQDHNSIPIVVYLVVGNLVDQRGERNVVASVGMYEKDSDNRRQKKAIFPELRSVLEMSVMILIAAVVITPAKVTIVAIAVLLLLLAIRIIVLSVFDPSASTYEHYLFIIVVLVFIFVPVVVIPGIFLVVLDIEWIHFCVGIVGHDEKKTNSRFGRICRSNRFLFGFDSKL